MMATTKFRELTDQMEALTPMCNFSQPEALCSEEETYFRRQYKRANQEMTALVNVTTTEDNKSDEEKA